MEDRELSQTSSRVVATTRSQELEAQPNMTDPAPLPLPPGLLALRGRQLRPESPSRPRHDDDLLSLLSPRTAADALRNPSGVLKACMDAASPSEQAFAIRAAAASKKIQQWLDELATWSWPEGGGSAGSAGPKPNRRSLSRSDGALLGTGDDMRKMYIGGLPAFEVIRYEKRIEHICQDLDGMDVEEIKTHVLHNHILPLSRPGTPVLPMPESNRSAAMATCPRMDDFTAMITATIIQTLPNLSKLTRLLRLWNVRFMVLKKTSVFWSCLADAEAALQSGWATIAKDAGRTTGEGMCVGQVSVTKEIALSRDEFLVMKSVLDRKISRAGRELDGMLDALDGQPDTLPDMWLDRMDAAEKDYAEWVIACEGKMRKDEHRHPSSVFAPELAPTIKVHSAAEAADTYRSHSHQDDANEDEGKAGLAASPDFVKTRTPRHSPHGVDGSEDRLGNDATEESDSPAAEESEPELPALQRPTRDSGLTLENAMAYGKSSGDTNSISDLSDHSSPGLPRLNTASRPPAIEEHGPSSSPPDFSSSTRSLSANISEMPTVTELPDEGTPPQKPRHADTSSPAGLNAHENGSPSQMSISNSEDKLQQQISDILQALPAKIRLSSEPAAIDLNPPDFQMPTGRAVLKPSPMRRSQSSWSLRSNTTPRRTRTPSFLLSPANPRPRQSRGNQDIRLYHLQRQGEAPIKLFIRCVGEHGERVMVRVGGGWADLGEYLKEYASHHGRRSGGETPKVEVKDLPASSSRVSMTGSTLAGSSPPSRPVSALGRPMSAVFDSHPSPMTPLRVRKARRSPAGPLVTSEESKLPQTNVVAADTPPPPPPPLVPLMGGGTASVSGPPMWLPRSRSNSRRLSWAEEDSSLGMAGPRARNIEMTEESRAWVESVKEKVRVASGEQHQHQRGVGQASATPEPLSHARASAQAATPSEGAGSVFGELGKVGSTKRVFRRGG